jgi:hypothetical protein
MLCAWPENELINQCFDAKQFNLFQNSTHH